MNGSFTSVTVTEGSHIAGCFATPIQAKQVILSPSISKRYKGHGGINYLSTSQYTTQLKHIQNDSWNLKGQIVVILCPYNGKNL